MPLCVLRVMTGCYLRIKSLEDELLATKAEHRRDCQLLEWYVLAVYSHVCRTVSPISHCLFSAYIEDMY